MQPDQPKNSDVKAATQNRHLYYQNGRFYFSRQLERRIFFFLTLVMLIWGLLEKFALL